MTLFVSSNVPRIPPGQRGPWVGHHQKRPQVVTLMMGRQTFLSPAKREPHYWFMRKTGENVTNTYTRTNTHRHLHAHTEPLSYIHAHTYIHTHTLTCKYTQTMRITGTKNSHFQKMNHEKVEKDEAKKKRLECKDIGYERNGEGNGGGEGWQKKGSRAASCG